MRAVERGATAVVVAVVLALLCGFVALSLDIGHGLSVRGELQNGADAGALAGARRLNGTNRRSELTSAETEARNYAGYHPTDIYDVEPTTIELGAWVPDGDPCPPNTTGVSTRKYGYKMCVISARTEEAAANITAVRVVTSRTGAAGSAGGGAVELAFGAFAGRTTADVVAEAIALSGGPASQACPDLPVAIRAGCVYENGELRCDSSGAGHIYYIGLSSAPTDTAGLTSLSDDPASASRICSIVEGACNPIRNGTSIRIQEGTSWSSNCADGCSAQDYRGANRTNDSICEVIRRMADSDCDGAVDIGPDGKPLNRRQVPIIQYPGESLASCSGGDHWNQSATVVGWGTVSIVSARCEDVGDSGNKLPMAPSPGARPITALCDQYMQAHGLFSTSSCVAIQFFCDEEDDEETAVGGGWFGTVPMQPVLVR